MSHTLRGAAALVLCLGALTACAGDPVEDPGRPAVVTFQSASAGVEVAAPPAGRPVERLDMNQAERDALHRDYMQCLKQAGVPLGRNDKGQLEFNTDEGKMKSQDPAVLKACSMKEPLRPLEMDPDRNPYYEEDRLASIKCQIAHGIKWEKSPNGKYDGLPPDPSGNPALEQAQLQCNIQHMNGKRG
jgi:hypothetical protein